MTRTKTSRVWLQRSLQYKTWLLAAGPALRWGAFPTHVLTSSFPCSAHRKSGITQWSTIYRRHIFLADTSNLSHLLSVLTASAASPRESWCWVMAQLSSVYRPPRDLKNHSGRVAMTRKQVTQKDLLRGQLESVLSDYRSAAFLPMSSSQSQPIQCLEKKK